MANFFKIYAVICFQITAKKRNLCLLWLRAILRTRFSQVFKMRLIIRFLEKRLKYPPWFSAKKNNRGGI